jgi:hypothetical protein
LTSTQPQIDEPQAEPQNAQVRRVAACLGKKYGVLTQTPLYFLFLRFLLLLVNLLFDSSICGSMGSSAKSS